jgi:hypothetical protein
MNQKHFACNNYANHQTIHRIYIHDKNTIKIRYLPRKVSQHCQQ